VRAASAAFFCAAFRAEAFCAAEVFEFDFDFKFEDVFFFAVLLRSFLVWAAAAGVGKEINAAARDALNARMVTNRIRNTNVVYCGKSLPRTAGLLSANILITSAVK
jgi:hypothetical protein